jgi:uracil phosphoribosyltransferase
MTDQHLTVVDHPLVQHKLTLMREHDTSTASFRQLLREISLLLAYEVTRELPMTTKRIETPLCEMDAPVIEGKKLALISILRAGNGLLDGILELIPAARVGFVGLYRDPETLQPVQYYFKVPTQLEDRVTIVVDPMLATGNSSAAAISLLKQAGAKNIRFVGWQDEETLAGLVGNAIAVIYVPKDEDFGMSAVEAMAAGKPVIGVDEGGLRESLIPGKTGILLPADPTPEAIVMAVRQLSPAIAVSMREACEARASYFSRTRFLAAFAEIIE